MSLKHAIKDTVDLKNELIILEKKVKEDLQKKKEETSGFKLFVFITFKAIKEPNKYEPLSPKKIFDLGKLNNTKEAKTNNWPVIIIAN